MPKYLAILIVVFLVIKVSAFSHRDSVSIYHYNLNLDMTGAVNGKISGEAELKVVLNYATNNITLDLFKLTTDSVRVNNVITTFLANDTIINISIPASTALDTLEVKVYYQGFPQEDKQWGGFFRNGTFAYNIGVGMGSYPHGIGRFWYPCNDAFTDRATYDYYIKTRSGENAVASGELVNTTQDGDNTIYHWQLTNTIPTYLSSVAVGPFVKITDTYTGINKNIPIEIYCAKSDSSASIQTFAVLKETLAAFEQNFGPYQWQRVGYVIVPFTGGAMEHATNIAFPQNQLGSSSGSKTLAAHELAHHWFGNLVTCSTSQDMWLNEGWASYCEVVFKEEVYGIESAKTHILNNQLSVIKSAHLADGGYYALNNLHPDITYGSTAYNKGALVVHCIRGYLGDELFFSGVKEFLKQNEYTSISSEYLQQELSKITGVDLTGFFNNWVYQPGFPHYSVGYFSTTENNTVFITKVQMVQKLKARTEYSNQNKVMLSFIDAEYKRFDTIVSFNNKNEVLEFELATKPVAVFTDINNMVLDASTDNTQTIFETGFANFDNCDFKTETHSINDSALVRVQFNFAEADDFTIPINGLTISNYHYWKVEGVFPEGFVADGKFSYNFSQNTNPESNYSVLETDTLVLLYRADSRSNWGVKAKGTKATINTGYIWTTGLNKGEYALGYWDGETPIGINDDGAHIEPAYIYPNPIKNNFHVNVSEPFTGSVVVYNTAGDTIYKLQYTNKEIIELSGDKIKSGLFFVNLKGNINTVIKGVKE